MTRDETGYWVWLQYALGISAALRTQEIADAFAGGAKEIYHASDYDRRISGVFTRTQLERLQAARPEAARDILEECRCNSVHILTPDSPLYPAHLRQIPNFPLALYVKGSLECLQIRLGIAIVGTRRADRKSVDIAGRLSADLVRAGCAVVSGGALGIDSAAHWGALHADGSTVAVLGCGLFADYLPENAGLRAKIAQTGAVVSEYPGTTAPIARNFPTRNRIISGMTAGTIVVEAGERSGSLITATCAAEQGRDVFAVPGDAFGSTYTGGNKLIREGAKPVFSAMDVLEEYECLYPEKLNMRQAARNLNRAAVEPEKIIVKTSRKGGGSVVRTQAASPATSTVQPKALPQSPAEQTILMLLSQGSLHIDDIVKAANLPLGEVFAALTALEINGLARQLPGRLYESKLL